LAEVISRLESMPNAERLRWLDFVSYIHAMIYHERSAVEQGKLLKIIEQSVQTELNRQEVQTMKTMAQVLEEQGEKKGEKKATRRTMQQILLRLLAQRFGEIDKERIAVVQRTSSVKQLQSWLDAIHTSKSLDDLKISR
ncbi:MAG: hypothetical protein O3A00_23755, partial [Planctomycetota bacterium]|nr:hypothetical protein [Planctomycetota bacterium]